jgi:diguanylate cyclase (GGDEF)-like protein
MKGLVIIFSLGLPVSLLRWHDLGFQFIFLHHILITLLTLACYFRPRKSNYKIDFIFVLAMLSSMIISGTLSFGLQAGTVSFAVFCAFLIAFVWGTKVAIFYSIVWCVFLLTCGYLFINSYIAPQVAPSIYSMTYGSWAIVAIGSSLTIVLMLIIAKEGYMFMRSLIDEIERQKEKIECLANTDSLTGFNTNRLTMPLLSNAVNLAKRDDSKIAVCFVDLNKFKQVNDTLGHEAGDIVLQITADRIRKSLREIDITCRIGGDEFLIILPKLQDTSDIPNILQRMVNATSPAIENENANISIGLSIGVAIYPGDGETAEDLRRNADNAMYYAKTNDQTIKFHNTL